MAMAYVTLLSLSIFLRILMHYWPLARACGQLCSNTILYSYLGVPS